MINRGINAKRDDGCQGAVKNLARVRCSTKESSTKSKLPVDLLLLHTVLKSSVDTLFAKSCSDMSASSNPQGAKGDRRMFVRFAKVRAGRIGGIQFNLIQSRVFKSSFQRIPATSAWVLGLAFLVSSLAGLGASAAGLDLPKPSPAAPECVAYGKAIAANNEQVIRWKKSTANQFKERGHVLGIVTKIYDDRPSHDHFQIQLAQEPGATLEVIYNSAFGALPELQVGDKVQACGDYITSTAQSGPYPASPDGAIIHWVHRNPRPSGHDHGFVIVNDRLYGFDIGNAARDRRPQPRFLAQ
jgi:hypothetical protein